MKKFREKLQGPHAKHFLVAAHDKIRSLTRESRYEKREAKIDAAGAVAFGLATAALFAFNLVPAALGTMLAGVGFGIGAVYHRIRAVALGRSIRKNKKMIGALQKAGVRIRPLQPPCP